MAGISFCVRQIKNEATIEGTFDKVLIPTGCDVHFCLAYRKKNLSMDNFFGRKDMYFLHFSTVLIENPSSRIVNFRETPVLVSGIETIRYVFYITDFQICQLTASTGTRHPHY
jgi:hypothetical protein